MDFNVRYACANLFIFIFLLAFQIYRLKDKVSKIQGQLYLFQEEFNILLKYLAQENLKPEEREVSKLLGMTSEKYFIGKMCQSFCEKKELK